jgi:hypothetical protein
MSRADDYRERAAECQRHADGTVTPTAREMLRDSAKKYLALAANEERDTAFSPGAADRKGKPPPDVRR